MNWQPISTAPKESTVFLLCRKDYHHWDSVCVGFYSTDWNTWLVRTSVNERVEVDVTPIAWMPLPELQLEGVIND